MTSLHKVLIAGAISVSALFLGTGGALAQGACPLCGSQVPSKEIDKAVSEAANAHGLIRSTGLLIGQMNNYEYVGEGTMVDLEAATLGAAVPVKRYLFNAHQQLWAARNDFEAGGGRTIRVVKGNRAWDETWSEEKTKVGTVRKLKTSPVSDAIAKFRAQMIWLQPQMFLNQVAFAAAKKCLTPEIKACDTKWSVGQENGKTVMSVDINGLTYKGALNANKHVESVSTTVTLPGGGAPKAIVAKYSGWRVGESEEKTLANLAAVGDKSLDKFHNGVFWPNRVSYELEGQKVLDLVVSEGWNNPYTIFPEPELLAKAQ